MRYYLVLFYLMLATLVKSQALYSSSCNLFTRGKKIECVSDNIDNLKKNVECSDKKVRILKFEKYGVVKDSVQVILLVKYNYLNAPFYIRSVSYENTEIANPFKWKIKYVNLEKDSAAISRKKYLFSEDGKYMLEKCAKGICSGNAIYKLIYSIENKEYEEFVFIKADGKSIFTSCSFWGFISAKDAMLSFPLGNWVKSRPVGNQVGVNSYFADIPMESVFDSAHVKISNHVMEPIKYTPMSLPETQCKFASFEIFTPANMDDIHIVVDIVWKETDGNVVILNRSLRLIGGLAKNAIFAKELDDDFALFTYNNRYNSFLGSIYGHLYYISGNRKNNILVHRQFMLENPKQ